MKTNKELYEELKKLVDKANSALKDAEDFAVPKTDEVRSEYSEDMYPTEDVEPSEDAGFYSPDDRGTFWVSSNCW
jgi:hypothetical protein